ncbi:MAG: hypothetical protein CL573_01155 [Alphaproteobacteria bacterium]|nr:hypothetical protein [Alphaproteobacteria bacterium]
MVFREESQDKIEKPGGGISVDRRDFLTLVFGSVSAVAISGGVGLWPTEAASRPLAEPARLALDYEGYVIDPLFEYCPELPTFRELIGLEDNSPLDSAIELKDELWRFEHIDDDPQNWSERDIKEITAWLDKQVEIEDLGPWQAMKYTEYGAGLRLHESMSFKDAERLGFTLVECPTIGSDFVGLRFDGDIEELNQNLARLGMNLIIAE